MDTITLNVKTTAEKPVVPIKGSFFMYGSTFCVHRCWFGWNESGRFDGIGHVSKESWGVSEYNTGTSIPTRGNRGESPKTRKQAVELAKEYLAFVGESGYRKAFRSFYNQHGYLNVRTEKKAA